MEMLLSTLRQWWWKRGHQRFYGSQADRDNPYALNAGTPERFEALVTNLRALIRPTIEDRVLDLGGGNGLLSRRVFSGCRQVVVSDFCLSALQEARPVAHETSLVVADMKQPPFRRGTFTTLFSYSTLPHIGSEAVVGRMIDAWDALLVDGGTIFIGDIPDRGRLRTVASRGFHKAFPMDSLKYFAAISMISYFSQERLHRMLSSKNYNVTILTQADSRRFHDERFDLIAKKRG